MPNPSITAEYTEPCHIYNKGRGWWQCGVWVESIHDATTYTCHDEAEKVILLRSLRDVDIIDA